MWVDVEAALIEASCIQREAARKLNIPLNAIGSP